MPFQNRPSSPELHKKLFFFFISAALCLQAVVILFDIFMPFMNLLNALAVLGFNSLVMSDIIIVINILYQLILIISAIYIYLKKDFSYPLLSLIMIIILLFFLSNPVEIVKLVNFITLLLGQNTIIGLLPEYQVAIYGLNWGLTGIIGALLLVFIAFSCIKCSIKKPNAKELLGKFGKIGVCYLIIKSIDLIFAFIYSLYFMISDQYYLIQQGIFIISLFLGCLFLFWKRSDKFDSYRLFIGKFAILLFGIVQILAAFNELNIEIMLKVALQITLGIFIVLSGLLFDEKLIIFK